MASAEKPKLAKSAVQYQRGHRDSHCGPLRTWPHGSCKNFEPPQSCAVVRGTISRGDWCIKWVREAAHG